VDAFLVQREVSPAALGRQPLRQVVLDAGRGGDALEVGPLPPDDIDPQQLAFIERVGDAGPQLDVAIAAVRVVEARPDARAAAGRTVQRATASRVTTTSATTAVPYCRTFMARSPRAMRRFLAAPTGTPPTTDLTIDVLTSCGAAAITATARPQRPAQAIPRARGV
jgi:hypothetical protein